MKLYILYFAGLREELGRDQETLFSCSPLSLKALRDIILKKYSYASESILNAEIAVNRKKANFDVVLQDGDEIAFLPPVSGG